MARLTLVPLLTFGLILQGCGINSLRTGYAGKVGTTSIAAADSARRFLGQVDASRQITNIELAAADPACARTMPLLREQPDVGIDAPQIGFLCVDKRQAAPPPGRAISMLPLGDELEPTLLLAQSLASYGDAMAAIIEDDPDAPSDPLIEALGLARAAQDALQAISSKAPTPIPAADDPRLVAATGLIDFLGELSREAAQVKQLRALVANNPDEPGKTIGLLKRQIGSWERARSADAGLVLILTNATAQAVLDADPPKSAESRRTALQSYYAKDKARRDEARIAPALLQLLEAVETADADLRNVLRERPDLSKEERRRIAQINRARIVTGLNHVTALAKALKGG